MDVSFLVIATILSLSLTGGLHGVREGSVIAALIVGPIIRGINRLFPHFENVAPTKGQITWVPTN